jgi:hypothetical protein
VTAGAFLFFQKKGYNKLIMVHASSLEGSRRMGRHALSAQRYHRIANGEKFVPHARPEESRSQNKLELQEDWIVKVAVGVGAVKFVQFVLGM